MLDVVGRSDIAVSMEKLVQPVVLAGGAGTRLWPVSTEVRPKHLLEIVGSGTMIEQTLSRVSNEAVYRRPLIVGASSQADEVASLAPAAELILEPCPRGSAAAVAFAALAVDRDAILLILPSDHHIADTTPLDDAVRRALPAAESGRLVTFGIRPAFAETGYGYITAGAEISTGVLEAISFIEKPAIELATDLVASGTAFWNSGMFMFRAGALLDELKRHSPAIFAAAEAAMSHASRSEGQTTPCAAALEGCPSTSIDYAVMEHSDRIAVVPVKLDWSDVGSWAAVYDLGTKDLDGNVLGRGGTALGSSGCLIRSDGPEIVAVGVKDLIVVATNDHVLVVPRSDAQRVREAAERMKRRDPSEL